jgi:hypothetical protein
MKKSFLLMGFSSLILLTACGTETSSVAVQESQSVKTERAHAAHDVHAVHTAHADLNEQSSGAAAATAVALDVYKSETCGCCGGWVEHMQSQDFATTIHHPVDLAAEKEKLGVAPRYQSCHTSVSKDGYVFEGHIPAKFVQQFLNEKPEGAIGLAVPGMPLGSPGMEAGDRFTAYDILVLKQDGSSEVYASVQSAEAQYQPES